MKTGIIEKLISIVLAGVMLISAPAVLVRADDNSEDGRYVSEVFIAYGKSQDDANKWLTDNGWEPISGDNNFTAGKNSAFDKGIVTVMGIKRTNDPNDAVTDMAVMNMKGGYSFPDYEALVEEKKTDINEFINNFIPVLEEYRTNYNNQGGTSGKARADLAYYILNKFFDGDPEGKYAVNDTGLPLGDLLLSKTRQEGNETGADLQQILLESSGAAVAAVETALSLAADTAETTWLDRMLDFSSDELSENLSKYVPEAEGQDVAPSAATGLLRAHFGDAAATLAAQWDDINERMIWYEWYNDVYGLWQEDDEDDDAYVSRVEKYFADLKEVDAERFDEEADKYNKNGMLYNVLYAVPYEGAWGESFGDFFFPMDGTDYSGDTDAFLPIAAALSEGQRAGVQFLSLYNLIFLGMNNEEGMAELFPDVDEILGGAENISIYSGINRGIFRGGVALTSNALMESSKGNDPFGDIWSFSGIYNITCYSAAIAGFVAMAAGAALWRAGIIGDTIEFNDRIISVTEKISDLKGYTEVYATSVKDANIWLGYTEEQFKAADIGTREEIAATQANDLAKLNRYERELQELEPIAAKNQTMSVTGKVVMGIGGALLIAAAFIKGYQMYKYYQRTFTQIPLMIVDEADIVSYTTDSNGNEIKNIDFNDFLYYQAVRCNRPDVGKISDWQDGVSDYEKWGCGDVADLNGDFGQEWLALYTVKATEKGNPILADSLKLQYGSDKQPEGTTQALHFFTYTYALDLGDTAYSYNNKKGGVYFFWDEDEDAFTEAHVTASAFSGGYIALAAAAGLIIGILGTTLVLLPRRKKKNEA